MIKYFIKSFKLTNENIILTTPLVLFLLLFFVYMGLIQNAASTVPAQILLTSTILFMVSAFFAGWLFMVKSAINLDKAVFESEEEKAKSSFGLLKKIPAGIGEYFFSFLGAIILYTILLKLLYFIIFQIGIHYISNMELSVDKLNSTFSNLAATEKILSAMTHAQLAKFSSWVLLFFTSVMSFYFLTMFWFVHIVLKNKNPLIALFGSVKTIFKNLLESIILFVYISLINIFTVVLNSLLTGNVITQFISMLISFYFVVYIVVLIFLYYDNTINRKLDSKTTDGEIPNNSNSGSDSIGEEQSGDTDSKEP